MPDHPCFNSRPYPYWDGYRWKLSISDFNSRPYPLWDVAYWAIHSPDDVISTLAPIHIGTQDRDIVRRASSFNSRPIHIETGKNDDKHTEIYDFNARPYLDNEMNYELCNNGNFKQ